VVGKPGTLLIDLATDDKKVGVASAAAIVLESEGSPIIVACTCTEPALNSHLTESAAVHAEILLVTILLTDSLFSKVKAS
jgi:hypothetical protein